jgi:signal peptidase I
MGKQWRKQFIVFVRGWVGSIVVAVLVATSIKSAIADWNVVPTGSMKPTIVEGDRIFVNKLAYDLKIPYTTWHLASWDDPSRGDIVVFYSPEDGMRLVKRVIGVPGDTVAMRRNRLFINGHPIVYESFNPSEKISNAHEILSGRRFLVENLAGRKHPVMLDPDRSRIASFDTVTIPKGRYLMLGDNRDNSADSRYFGLVERRRIVGRATAVVISLDREKYYQPRWARFFTKLP